MVAVRRSHEQLVPLWATVFCGLHAYYLRKQCQLYALCAEPTRLSHYTAAQPLYVVNFFQRFFRNCGEVRTLLRRRFTYRYQTHYSQL